jgi:hypothetical protein
MDDKSLADAVVALGVGQHRKFGGVPIRYRFVGSDENMYASEFIRDPRVAMALMEKVDISYTKDREDRFWKAWHSSHIDKFIASDKSLPRAITEACVEALS